jgi:hypothetical protein
LMQPSSGIACRHHARAVARVASSRLGAALLLTPSVPSMRLAVVRAAFSGCRLDAALVLAPFASSMRLAVPRATFTPLGAALLLARPPTHGTPPGSLMPPKPQLTAARSAVTHPLSALNTTLVHTGHTTVAVREQVRRWVQHVSVKVVKSAWAGGVRWVCSRAEWTGPPPHPPPPGSQAASPVVPHLQTLMVGSNTPHDTASTARRRDTLECTCYSEGGPEKAVWVVSCHFAAGFLLARRSCSTHTGTTPASCLRVVRGGGWKGMACVHERCERDERRRAQSTYPRSAPCSTYRSSFVHTLTEMNQPLLRKGSKKPQLSSACWVLSWPCW